MLELGMILESLQKIWWLLVLFGGFAIFGYRVRVHEKALFGPDGELNFVTKKENYVHLANQLKKDEEIKVCIDSVKHETCPVHESSIDLIKEIKSIQQGNIQRMNNFEEVVKEGKQSREKIQEALGVINSSLATVVANLHHVTSEIKDIKSAHIAGRSL